MKITVGNIDRLIKELNRRRRKMFYEVVEFNEWSAAARKLERKWDCSLPKEIKKRGYVRFMSFPEADYTFCVITNKSGSKTYGCGWAKRIYTDDTNLITAHKVSFNRAVEDVMTYLGWEG